MNNMMTLRGLPRVAAAAAAIFLAAALSLFMPASGAFAHDAMLGSTPADGETIDRMPDEIKLKFSANVAGLGSTTKIQDAEGNDWTSGEAQIVNNSMIQKTSPDAPAGEYTVLWRAVSSDSHPIEGTFTFTVTAGAQAAPEGTPEAAEPTTAQNNAAASTAPSAETASENESAGGGMETTAVLIGAGLILLLIVGVIAYVVRKKAKTEN